MKKLLGVLAFVATMFVITPTQGQETPKELFLTTTQIMCGPYEMIYTPFKSGGEFVAAKGVGVDKNRNPIAIIEYWFNPVKKTFTILRRDLNNPDMSCVTEFGYMIFEDNPMNMKNPESEL